MLTLNPHLSWIYSPAPLLAGAGTECRLRAAALPASSARYPDSIRSIRTKIRRRPREYYASLRTPTRNRITAASCHPEIVEKSVEPF